VPITENNPGRTPDKWNPPWGVPVERVEIVSGNVTLVADYYENEADESCAVIILHGLNATRGMTRLYGPLFYDLGCDVLGYDARAHGESSPAFLTYGYYDREDAVAVLHWLSERSGLETSQIGMLGQSYGAATALQILAIEPDVAFVVADSSYQDMYTIITQRANVNYGSWINLFVPGAFQMAEWRANIEVDDVSPLRAVQGVTTPILLIHSLQDAFTLPSHSEAIYAASNHATTRLVLTDYEAAHAESIIVNQEGFTAEVYDFLAEYVPGFGSQQ
jgi:pimeloyl-ACP methyl ester carboxylesterase